MKIISIIAVAGISCAWAQTRPANTYKTSTILTAQANRLVSPDVKADRTVVFSLRAPQANLVTLTIAGQAGQKPMTKSPEGVWSATLGPFEPEIYSYNFIVDGVRILDPASGNIKGGRVPDGTVFEIPGSPARFDEIKDVPHGALSIRTYRSTALKKVRQLYVYTPPQYDSEPGRRFPVLYLRHGSGDTEENWSGSGGRAGVILDNLIAVKKAVPMIIVMPNGDTDGSWNGGSSPEGIEVLGQELLTDIIPMIAKTYRVAPGRDNRAIAGLSMGGGQAFTIGLRHLELFSWVGEFSSGLVSDVDFRVDKQLPGFMDDSAKVNRQLHLLFISCGTEDPRYPGHLDLVDSLRQHKIETVWFPTPGAHEWKVWRHSLADFASRAFKQPAR